MPGHVSGTFLVKDFAPWLARLVERFESLSSGVCAHKGKPYNRPLLLEMSKYFRLAGTV